MTDAFECYKGLKNEKIKNESLKVKRFMDIDAIIENCESYFDNLTTKGKWLSYKIAHNHVSKLVEEEGITKEYIEKFVLHELNQFTNRDRFQTGMGCYITALLANVLKKGENIKLDLSELKYEHGLNYLRNPVLDTIVTMEGGLYDCIGYENVGNLLIKGDVKSCLGMKGLDGEIILLGNALDCVGYRNKGTNIYVHGKARNRVGERMEGGKIRLYGGYKNISGTFYRGEIYDNDKLLKFK